MELHRKYRPKTLDQVIGQPEAVKFLKGKVKKGNIPHTILISGLKGSGKTTLARILASHLGCNPKNESDFQEINCGVTEDPIGTVRRIQQTMNLYGMAQDNRVWILDEIGALQRAKYAQQALLKILEEPPSHVYFFLCTTDPQKLLPTIIDRCTHIRTKRISDRHLGEILDNVIVKEKLEIKDEIRERLIECADGSGRRVLVLLEQVMQLESEKEQLKVLVSTETKKQGIDLARKLIFSRPKWGELISLLKGLEDEEPETVRRIVLGYARAMLLSDKWKKFGPRAAQVISCFGENFYGTEAAGLALAAWDSVGEGS